MPNDYAKIIIATTHGELSKVRNVTAISGTINALKCQVEFRTNDWNNTNKVIVFARGRATSSTPSEDIFPPQMLDDENECVVPAGALCEKYFSIGVIGVGDNYRIVTNWLHYRVDDGCYADGGAIFDPPKTIYDQILEQLKNKSDIGHNHNDLYYTKDESNEKYLTAADLPTIPVTSVNNKTGNVVLVAEDVGAFANTVNAGVQVPTIPYAAIIDPPKVTIDETALNTMLKEVLV
jgi:hypothetical protein